MKVKYVEQDEKNGCGIACLAMVLGTTYAEVRKHFETDFEKKGVPFDRLVEYLGECGHQIVKKEVLNWEHVEFTRQEMLKPFAPMHIVNVQQQFDSKDRHCVVMDANGKLYCPSGQTQETIQTVYAVHEVAGLWKSQK